ncbi:Crp/Fnr family transcriptional regulator [Corticibacter populi]|uniref:Crp/Fnr family transcriptional regulator n=1 Tax=Corticibacter populi TaxID=1550736 RepID=A0A3M6QS83_9BURK|nr:Crp/Fnr family transcriptional regulator [Corticibacter populi]RMX05843.1 Crp/Fnr family transcriptional regulator [Corticibacter populi]RZS30841.1 Crp/Fnr family transcriptional regulator [Corticibacter populi]
MTPPLSLALIRRFDLFAQAPDETLQALLLHAQVRRLAAGEALFQQAETATHFFLLLGGTLKVVKTTPQGEQVVVRFVRPGDLLGIARLLNRPDYPATASAIEDSLALAWPCGAWERMLALHPRLAGQALQTVGQRLQGAHTRIEELATEEVEQRVAHTLLRLVAQSGQPQEDGRIAIGFPITRQDIAEMTGTTLHTVSRLLSAWQERGIVENGRKRVAVRDQAALQRLASGAERRQPQ